VTRELPVLVVTSGEPAGIGPDICLALAKRRIPARLAVLGDPRLLEERAALLDTRVTLRGCTSVTQIGPHLVGSLQVMPAELRAPVTAGRLDTANAEYVLDMIKRAVELCVSQQAQALVTAPVQKSVIAEAGFEFSGHTELLGELTHVEQPIMMLASRKLRVVLATTHLPLRAVADALDAGKLERLVRTTHSELATRFGIERPRVLVLGLNPHAGEHGTLGREEQSLIEPVLRKLAADGLAVAGPVSADTAFTPDSLERCDVVIAMYHDQGLPALKALSFGEIVNVTLGLPIIRTSVDHGTALPLAGTGRARPESLVAAVELAIELARAARSASS
jgi:4-hydroxythreonine-4-phosphate dehydrogenase